MAKLCFSLLLFVCSHVGAVAQERALLYPVSLSGSILELANMIRDPHSRQVPLDQLPAASRYFVRIAPRDAILTKDKQLKPDAFLAATGKPFVFLTTPQSVYGRSLLEIYEDIGYEAEGIVGFQRNKDMVAILFRYPDNVIVSNVRNGRLESDWANRLYPTTWDNILSLFPRLVRNERSQACKASDLPAKVICLPPKQNTFILRFPLASKRRLKTTSYTTLRAFGGPVWQYRKLLEDKLSVFEHFRGDGRTENEMLDVEGQPTQPRLIEVVGPNKNLNNLLEVAIIDLGKLFIEDCYFKRSEEFKCVKK
jgi:hypothetical protein